jgi:hypothetical protein
MVWIKTPYHIYERKTSAVGKDKGKTTSQERKVAMTKIS